MINNRLIKKGSVIGIINPAGPADIEDINKFRDLLISKGYLVKIGKSCYRKMGYLAGDDIIRASDINEMFKDPQVKCIIAYKGGYGCARLLPYLDYDLIKSNPKLLIGFSDITVLLNVLYYKCNIPSMHGEMGLVLRRENKEVNDLFFDNLENGFTKPLTNIKNDLIVINEGICEGVLVGGNLSLIYSLMGTPYELDLTDKILFIEDVSEDVYSVDRMLNSLKLSNNLHKLKGVIVGYFTDYTEVDEYPLNKVLDHYLKELNIPYVINFESGHSTPFINIPIGLKVMLDTRKKSVIVLESYHFDN